MQKKYIYEYAVIRLLPKVEREEFVNIGLILFCKSKRYIRIGYSVDERKISPFMTADLGLDTLSDSLTAFEKIGLGLEDGGKIAQLEVAERFRWLTAVRSTCVQTSRPHSGITDDLDSVFDSLYKDLVL